MIIPAKKFIVIRESDLEKYSDINKPLNEILQDIINGRNNDCKTSDDEFWVVNKLEPYANVVWELIKEWELIRAREKSNGMTTEKEIRKEYQKSKEDNTLGINEFDIFKTKE